MCGLCDNFVSDLAGRTFSLKIKTSIVTSMFVDIYPAAEIARLVYAHQGFLPQSEQILFWQIG